MPVSKVFTYKADMSESWEHLISEFISEATTQLVTMSDEDWENLVSKHKKLFSEAKLVVESDVWCRKYYLKLLESNSKALRIVGEIGSALSVTNHAKTVFAILDAGGMPLFSDEILLKFSSTIFGAVKNMLVNKGTVSKEEYDSFAKQFNEYFSHLSKANVDSAINKLREKQNVVSLRQEITFS